MFLFHFNRMFNWVVKVVPQPPDAGTDDAAKTPDASPAAAVKTAALKDADEVSEEG